MRAFVDTNVALDVLLERQPFVVEAKQVWAASERRAIQGVIAALSFTTVYYVIRRIASRDKALEALHLLTGVFEVAPCDAGVIKLAMGAQYPDFEDAVQYHTAAAAGAEYIVTRNRDHFPTGGPAVLTPAEFLAVLASRGS